MERREGEETIKYVRVCICVCACVFERWEDSSDQGFPKLI